LEQRVSCADDADSCVTRRIGDSDPVSVFVSIFFTIFDTEIVPLDDTASDAVRGTGSVQQSLADLKPDPNPTTTTATTSTNPHAYTTATTPTNPHANAATSATAEPDSQPMPNVFAGRCPDTAGSDTDSSVDDSGCRAELHAQQAGDRHLLNWGKSSDQHDDRLVRRHILDQLHRGIAPWYRHSDRH
jgi:hypothetical protein